MARGPCNSCIAELRDSTQLPWLTNVTFWVIGAVNLGPLTDTSAVAAPAAAGAMLATVNDNGRSPFFAAFFNSWSARRASVPPMPPSTRPLLLVNETLGSTRLLSKPVSSAAVGTSVAGAGAGSCGSGAPKTTGCTW